MPAADIEGPSGTGGPFAKPWQVRTQNH
jgi:hypothetical protein